MNPGGIGPKNSCRTFGTFSEDILKAFLEDLLRRSWRNFECVSEETPETFLEKFLENLEEIRRNSRWSSGELFQELLDETQRNR